MNMVVIISVGKKRMDRLYCFNFYSALILGKDFIRGCLANGDVLLKGLMAVSRFFRIVFMAQ